MFMTVWTFTVEFLLLFAILYQSMIQYSDIVKGHTWYGVDNFYIYRKVEQVNMIFGLVHFSLLILAHL